jgi:signal transduction histidine kinase
MKLLRAVTDPLVENALRHSTAAQPVTIHVDTTGTSIRVRVSNDGAGVPVELRAQLFEPWIGRADGGLGLWLARESARSAGGDVTCDAYGPPITTFVARVPTMMGTPAANGSMHR